MTDIRAGRVLILVLMVVASGCVGGQPTKVADLPECSGDDATVVGEGLDDLVGDLNQHLNRDGDCGIMTSGEANGYPE